MPADSTLQPDRYHRGDTGDFRQVDASGNDSPVYGWSGGVAYRTLAAGTALTADDSETLLGSYSIPANTLVAGSIIKVRYQGIVTASNSTDTITIKLYIGGLSGTAILTGTTTDAANSDVFMGEAVIQIRTAGGSGTMVANGMHADVPEASGSAVPVYEITASTAIDTTAAQVVGVSGEWSTTNAGNSCRLDMLIVEIY